MVVQAAVARHEQTPQATPPYLTLLDSHELIVVFRRGPPGNNRAPERQLQLNGLYCYYSDLNNPANLRPEIQAKCGGQSERDRRQG